MTTAATTYAEYIRTGRLSPFVTSTAFAGGVIHVTEFVMPAGDMSSPPTDALMLVEAVSAFQLRSDLGAGHFSERTPAGGMLVIPPRYASDILVENPHAIRVFGLPEKQCRTLVGDAAGDRPLDFGSLHRGSFQDDVVAAVLRRLRRESTTSDHVATLFAEGALLTVLGALSRLATRTLRQPIRHCHWRVRRAIEIMEARLEDNVGLVELARAVDLSPSHFATVFRESMGVAPYRWLMQRRIQRARDMLSSSHLPITEVALACGFSSGQHFATVFRQHVGVTPSEFRRRRLP